MNGHCSACGEPITDYASPHCRCGHFLGWPNFRKAYSERDVLLERYQSATASLVSRSLSNLQAALEKLAQDAVPVISMTCEAADDLLRSGKYQNYHFQVEVGRRLIATELNHGVRLMVNHRIYPAYGLALHYAVLSPDGSGLGNYGEVAVSWDVTPSYLGQRSTLLEENEFAFFERHGLGGLDAAVPGGYRATWADRSKLAVVKLEPEMTAGTSVADLPALLLAEGTDRRHDRFIEVVVYGDKGIDDRDIRQVKLMKPITDPQRQERWQLVIEMCGSRGIKVS
ncbi:MAG TPA: hypothetical protein VF688_15210 [Allosphingosinicella sp.]